MPNRAASNPRACPHGTRAGFCALQRSDPRPALRRQINAKWPARPWAGLLESLPSWPMFGLNTVNRFEGGMNSRENNIGKIRVALEKAGIEFDTDGQGVRLRPPKPKGKRK